MLIDWLRSWKTAKPRSKRRRHPFAGTEFGQIAEILEDRLLLATILVDDDGGGDQTSIQEAIDAAVAGDEILVNGGDDGIHTEAGISINKNVTIRGVNEPSENQVIVQAASEAGLASDRVFSVSPSVTDATIDNLTIRYGNLAVPEFSVGLSGGGILNQGTLSITNSTLTENLASGNGGGIATDFLASTRLRSSTVSLNFANENGGGIHNAGRTTISNSTLSGNSAGNSGGGVYNQMGIEFEDTDVVITNSTIVKNRAYAEGGGANGESGTGGGIWTSPFEFATTRIDNTIVAGNLVGSTSNELPNDIVNNVDSASAFNLIGDPNSAGGLMHGDNGNIVGQDGIEGRELLDLSTVLDPLLADNGGPTLTHNLISGSPALDAGSNSLAVDPGSDGMVGTEDDTPLATDQRGSGFARIVDLPGIPNADGGVDIGAVEFNLAFIEIFPLEARQREGDAGPTEFTFLVTRSGNTSRTASVNYSVSPMTADAGDFVNNTLPSGTVVFNEEETFDIITIAVNGDLTLEPNETFVVELTTPSEEVEIETASAVGEILNDENLQVFGAGSGSGINSMPPQVIVELAATGEELDHFERFFAYDVNFRGGVRVASADVNGDGAPDVITAAGPGGGPHVRVFDGLTAQPIAGFFAYDPAFTGGVFVAAADIDGDGRADIITGADAGGGPHVRVFSGDDSSLLSEFFAYDPAFAGGVRVAAGKIDSDGTPDIITAAGPGGGPHVRVFDGAASVQAGTGVGLSGEEGSFFAYDPAFTGGVTVASGDVDDDGFDEIITGAGAGGGPHVRIFDGEGSLTALNEFFAFDASMTAGLFVGTTDANGDGIAEILVGTGSSQNQPSQVAIFNASGQTIEPGAVVFNPHFRSGVHVAGSLGPALEPIEPEIEPSGTGFPRGGVEFENDVMMQFGFDETTLDVLFNL